MSYQRIIIVGYPKSGNTWLTRLIAELHNAPVQGFLYSDHEEIAIEGQDRTGTVEIYKSHHQLHELSEEDRSNARLIYIIRDPRDLVISGGKYFKKFLRLLPNTQPSNSRNKIRKSTDFEIRINSLYKNWFGASVMRQRMIKAVLEGNELVHHWCRVSWIEHLRPYVDSPDVHKVKYESLLENPTEECRSILRFLGVELSDVEIQKAIRTQSFSSVKKKFEDMNLSDKATFLRTGKAEQWKSDFSTKEKRRFIQIIGSEIEARGYSLD